jgi:hypothetical protein
VERHELLHELQPVECLSCGATVGVRKHSAQHTSVQWSTASAGQCMEFQGGDSALIKGCGRLRMSIETAVLQGRVEVSDG